MMATSWEGQPISSHTFQCLLWDPQTFPSQFLLGLYPVGRAWYSLAWSWFKDIFVRFPNHLHCLLSIQSRGSTPKFSQTAELLTLPPWLSPAILWGNLFSAACKKKKVHLCKIYAKSRIYLWLCRAANQTGSLIFTHDITKDGRTMRISGHKCTSSHFWKPRCIET